MRITKTNIETALQYGDRFLRLIAAESEHFGPEHMEMALKDEDWYVRLIAVESKYFRPEHVEMMLRDESPLVREAVKNKLEEWNEKLNEEMSNLLRNNNTRS